MLKAYDVTCPECTEEFEVEMDPATEDEYIECPECLEEFDWDHDTDTDTVTLLPGDFEEDDDTPLTEEGDEGEDELA
jgi:DNA replicative helicase MCM subunit Mcm2 (Cdc46/Mcm family)